MSIKEENEITIKVICSNDELIKLLTSKDFNTINKLKKLVSELEIPIEKDNYFVKKAEDKLNKILNKK